MALAVALAVALGVELGVELGGTSWHDIPSWTKLGPGHLGCFLPLSQEI